jgi:purine nucleosidase
MRVLIDTDPGLGKKGADVDDGLALLFMLNHSNVFEIEGITTVFGNTSVKIGYKLLEQYLNLVNRMDIPHKIGARSKNDLGKLTEASKFMIDLVKENPNEITLLTLGPLTNISTALHHFPSLFDDLKKIVFMGGTIEPTNAFNEKFSIVSPHTEFNFYSDPNATRLFIEHESGTPRIGMGLDICCKVLFDEKSLIKMAQSNNPIPKFILEDLKYWFNLWKTYNGTDGFYPFDTFVPIYLMNPELFKFEDFSFKVDIGEIPGKLIKISHMVSKSKVITYALDFKEPNYGEKFVNILVNGLIK